MPRNHGGERAPMGNTKSASVQRFQPISDQRTFPDLLEARVGDGAFTDLLHEQKSTGCAKLSHAYSSALGGSVIAVCI